MLSHCVWTTSEFTKIVENVFVTSLKNVIIFKPLDLKLQRMCWWIPELGFCLERYYFGELNSWIKEHYPVRWRRIFAVLPGIAVLVCPWCSLALQSGEHILLTAVGVGGTRMRWEGPGGFVPNLTPVKLSLWQGCFFLPL